MINLKTKLTKIIIITLALSCNISHADNKVNYGAFYNQTRSLYSMYPGHYSYVMFGDSLTERGKWQDMFPQYSIGNRGISGDDTNGMLNRINDIEKTGAKKVFIMAGTNDLTRHVSPEHVAENIISMTKELNKKGIKVVIQSTILAGKKFEDKNKSIEAINNILKQYAESSKTPYIDLNAKLAENNLLKSSYTIDGIHLTAKGYEVWRSSISDFIK